MNSARTSIRTITKYRKKFLHQLLMLQCSFSLITFRKYRATE